MLSGVEERLAPLKAWLFPRRVLFQLEDGAITALVLNGTSVEWCEQVPLPIGLCEQGEPSRPESLGDLLGDLLVERGYAGARVEAVLPAAACQWLQVRWPDGRFPEEPQRQLAQHEETLKLRAPLSYLDLHLVPLALPEPTSLVLAVSSQLLERWIEVFSLAGASLVRLEASQLCLCRALSALPDDLLDAPALALLQLESEASTVLIVEQGLPAYERNLPGTADLAGLGTALERVLQFWCQEHPGAPRPPLLGHGTGLPEAVQLGLPVQVLDPLAEGWWQLEQPVPEGQQRPPGTALLPLWGLVAGESP